MKREVVTPYLVFIFLIVAFSGILMFFHLADDYTNVLHEFLGLAFAFFAILHIMNNWKSILNYSKKQLLITPGIIILIISITFVVIGKVKGNLESDLLEKLMKSPVYISFSVIHGDYQEARSILIHNNIPVKDSLESIESLSTKAQKSPEEIVELIMK